MPEKIPDAGPVEPASPELLRHATPPSLKRWGRAALFIALAIAALGVGWRMWKSHTTAQWTDDQAVPTVQIVQLAGAKSCTLNLPGEVQSFASPPIYAQVTGYMQKWYFDIGVAVNKGALQG